MNQTKEKPVAVPQRKLSKKEHIGASPEAEALPATPQTLRSDQAMDSDDDMNSVLSGSEDGFGEDADSSVDFGAGMSSSQQLSTHDPLLIYSYRFGQ